MLLGGGHTHAFLLRELRERPLRGGEVVLVSPGERHTYSGMLPGLIAGHYDVADLQIDLARLSRGMGGKLVIDSAVAIDPKARKVRLAGGAEMDYDLLSLNLGSLVDTSVPGSAEHALQVKPFESFLKGWETRKEAKRIAIGGGGAAGVEMAMAIRHRRPGTSVTIFSEKPAFSGRLSERIADALRRTGVEMRSDTPIERVEAGPVVMARGKHEPFDLVLWTAGAAPQPWLGQAGLANDAKGFVLVDATLRSVSHPNVFAAGDSATLKDSPHPKSGVFAVRHGPVLLHNLRAAFEGGPARSYEPQKKQLLLLSCGEKYAIANRGAGSVEGGWVWRWKDWIDRRWIARFR